MANQKTWKGMIPEEKLEALRENVEDAFSRINSLGSRVSSLEAELSKVRDLLENYTRKARK